MKKIYLLFTAVAGFVSMHLAASEHAYKSTIILENVKKHNVNHKDQNGNTPLLIAIMCNKNAYVKQFLHYGANPKIRNNQNQSTFDIAKLYKNREAWNILHKLHKKIKAKRAEKANKQPAKTTDTVEQKTSGTPSVTGTTIAALTTISGGIIVACTHFNEIMKAVTTVCNSMGDTKKSVGTLLNPPPQAPQPQIPQNEPGWLSGFGNGAKEIALEGIKQAPAFATAIGLQNILWHKFGVKNPDIEIEKIKQAAALQEAKNKKPK